MRYDNVTSSDELGRVPERMVEAVILTLIIVVAVTGNVSIWIIVLKSKVLRTVTNIFMLGLSAADLLVSTVNMPVTVVTLGLGYWSMSDTACVGFGFTNMLTLVTSVLSLCNISINRYIMVCRPASFKWIYTTRNAIVMITAVVITSFLLSTPPLYGWGEYTYIPIQSFCFCDWANHKTYAYFMIVCCFGVPCGVTVVCNILIYRAVQKSKLRITRSQAKSLRGESSKKKTLFSVISNTVLSRGNSTHSDDSCPGDIHGRKSFTDKDEPLDSHHLNVDWKERVQVLAGNSATESDTDRKITTVDNAHEAHSTTTAPIVPQRKKTKKFKRSEEIRLAMCLIIVVICFVLCWMPYCISMLLSIYANGKIPRAFHMFTLLIGYANSGCNPIIYGLMNRRYASGFRDIYCWWRKSDRWNISGLSSTDMDQNTTAVHSDSNRENRASII